MKILLDTHILLWYSEDMLPQKASDYVLNETNTLYFSPASIWEVVTKYQLGRSDFQTNPARLFKGLVENDCLELPITARHMLGVGVLPNIHKDPFDRILLAQAIAESCFLLTADKILAEYPGLVISV